MSDILIIAGSITLLALIASGGGLIGYLIAKSLIRLWERP